MLFSCELPCSVVIGENTELVHGGLGCVFHEKTVIGKNCKIFQNVTIGGLPSGGVPVIGDNVLIGAGAVILGNVNIGSHVKIGANAVVLSDVPDGCTAVGVPARIK